MAISKTIYGLDRSLCFITEMSAPKHVAFMSMTWQLVKTTV